ncbi:PREDICTED: receptor expression-enhancing protein 5-like [Ceratosolen solmsi marchali]|uniref:Receptor expression-enhancing protein n=1 Tax=Ceratosolen solmsi marchali TaxID=326594 RepID=A0AAJ7DVE1_9HYME|nr:PREDICTED: receptor expression-enhancing protein 5-like [Ceratosolen solmsi marchali]
MARIVAIKDTLEKALNDEGKTWTRYLILAERKTGVDRLYIFVALLIFLAIYLIIGIGQQLVSNVIGFMYPAYSSMKAIESKQANDDTKWLTYWVVFAVLTIIEYFVDFIIGWFPVYWLFKCLLYTWLMIPTEYNGSLIIYRCLIRPKFIAYQSNVDSLINDAKLTHRVRSSIFDSKNE